MHVGKSIFFQNLEGDRADEDVVRFELGLADAAEPQGFDSLFTAEHHFGAYHMAPNPLQILTYLAGRTSSVRLGSSVVVLPWHDPLRVAEELSVLDHVSRGRLLVGLGRGLGRHEFEGFGVEMGESRQRFQEYGELILDAFDTGLMMHEGDLVNQAPVQLRPAPMSPLRGRAYGSSISPDSMEVMARLKLGILALAQKPWEATERDVREYTEHFAAMHDHLPPKPLLLVFISVHESASAAREMHEQYTVRYARSTFDWYEFGNDKLATIPGYEYYGKFAANIAKNGADGFVNYLAELQVHGTPEQVLEQLTTNVRRIDGAGLLAVLSYAGMSDAVATANQELFARAVLPRLKAIDTDRDVPPVATTAPAAA
jgi:alkanesulfonate monooxygenase SsuD/methylene tetrahydromethanopterin reductase-like flavin-dependent oxidoreductase (luciferase family)